MKSFLLFSVILIMGFGISCKKDSLTNDLKGKWVRVDNPSDTITFGFAGQPNWFELFRGYQLGDDGINRPRIPFGIYEYKIQDNNISIYWIASSSSSWPDFYFSIKGSEIEMGNFIDSNNPRITFVKLK
jgi:hypothetical protein